MSKKQALTSAQAAIRRGSFGTALEHVSTVLLTHPTDFNALLIAGLAHFNLDAPALSADHYARAIDANPQSPSPYKGLLNLYTATGDHRQLTDRVLPRLIDLVPDKAPEYRLLHAQHLAHQARLSDAHDFLSALASPDPPLLREHVRILGLLLDQERRAVAARVRQTVSTPSAAEAAIDRELAAHPYHAELLARSLALLDDATHAELAALLPRLRAVSHPRTRDVAARLHALSKTELLPWILLSPSPAKFVHQFPTHGAPWLSLGEWLVAHVLTTPYLLAARTRLYQHAKFVLQHGASIRSATQTSRAALAQAHLALGDTDLAVKQAQLAESTELGRLVLADAYRQTGRVADASALYTPLLDGSDGSRARARQGLVLIDLDANPDRARELLADDDSAFGRVFRAWLTDRTTVAAAAAEAAPTDPLLFLYHFFAGLAYWERGGEFRTDKQFSHAQFYACVRANPSFAPGFTYLGHFFASGPKAVKCYARAVQLDAGERDAGMALCGLVDDPEPILRDITTRCIIGAQWAWQELGFLLQRKPDGAAESIVCLQNALRRDRTSVICWEGLADSYFLQGQFMASLKAYGRALELDSSRLHCRLRRGLVQRILGRREDAVREHVAAIDMAPDNWVALFGAAKAYHALAQEWGDEQRRARMAATNLEARAMVDRCLATVDGAHFVGALRLAGEIDAAPAPCAKAAHIAPERGILWYELGHALIKQGRHGPARTALQRAVLDPTTRYRALVALGYSLASTGDLDRAVHAFVKAIDWSPKCVEAWINLGFVYAEQGHSDLAERAFQEAREVDPTAGAAWVGLGMQRGDQVDTEFETASILDAGPVAELMRAWTRRSAPDWNTYAAAFRASADLARPATWNLLAIMAEAHFLRTQAAECYERALGGGCAPEERAVIERNLERVKG